MWQITGKLGFVIRDVMTDVDGALFVVEFDSELFVGSNEILEWGKHVSNYRRHNTLWNKILFYFIDRLRFINIYKKWYGCNWIWK